MNNNFLFTIFICFSLFACSENKDEAQVETPIPPVKYVVVGSNNIIGQTTYTGLAKARQEVDLSFKVGGTIQSIPVKVGDRVRSGQILAILDDADYQVDFSQSLASVKSSEAQIENAEAQLQNARANYLASQSNYQRYEKLYETGSISLSEFEQAKSNYLSAEASLNAAETQVEAAKAGKESSESQKQSASNQVSYTRMTAPFAGIVTQVNAQENEIVSQGNSIIQINSVENPDVEIGIPENVISLIENGQEVKVRFNSIQDKVFTGNVRSIGYSSSGTTFPVKVRLIDTDNRIRPGMPASGSFIIGDEKSGSSTLLVPPSAVGEDINGNFVYLLEGSGEVYTCKRQSVKIGKLSDAGFELLSGINNGDKVASAGLNVIRDGMQVRLYQEQ